MLNIQLPAMLVLGTGAALAFSPTTDANMNGLYPTQTGDLVPQQVGGFPANLSTAFADYPGGVEYFEVSSADISTTYGEVYWKPLPDMPLPPALVARFAGKGMAIVGFEADQVRTVGGKDVSLPINCAYNHHYGLNVVGAGSSMQRVKRDPARRETMGGHDAPGPAGFVDLAVEHTPSLTGLPTSNVFGYNNGGEFRKSYHALAPPFAQLVEGPKQVNFGPMQIDTWNRDKMSLDPGDLTPFVPGPQPGNSLAPRGGVDADYSGLLECPLTTRIRKRLTGGGWNDSYVAVVGGGGGCAAPTWSGALVDKALDCAGGEYRGSLGGKPSAAACLAAAKAVVAAKTADLNYAVWHGDSDKACYVCAITARGEPSTWPYKKQPGAVSFAATGTPTPGQQPAQGGAAACYDAAQELGLPAGARVANGTGASAALPPGCSVTLEGHAGKGVVVTASVYFNTKASSAVKCGGGPGGVTAVEGTRPTETGVTLGLVLPSGGAAAGASANATITLSGPADGDWFGVAFDTHFMANSPYAIVVDGAGAVTEHVLADHAAGIVLNGSVAVLSHTVAGGVRTLTLTRPLAGATNAHYTFDADKLSLDFITATGSGAAFGFHKAKTVGTLALWPAAPAPLAGGNFSLFGGAPAAAGTRNNYDGEVGYEVTVGAAPLTVTALGRANVRSDTAAVTVWDAATRKPVARAAVGPADGPPDSSGYTYASIAAPVVLNPGATYRVSFTATAGMADKWPDDASNAAAALGGAYLAIGDGVYEPQQGAYPAQVSADPTHPRSGRWAGDATLRFSAPPLPAPEPAPACVCEVPAAPFGAGTGDIEYLPTGEVIGFPPRCQHMWSNEVRNETVFTSRNPTCDVRTYQGGLSVCHHGWHLLDADQEVPWADQPLVYHFKFRFYYQEYNVQQQHVSTFDTTWGIGGATGEYDVPVSAKGKGVDANATHVETGYITPPGTDMHFVAAHFHCHAPTCLTQEMRFDGPEGELICREDSYHGKGATPGDRFGEKGYIAQPVCMWGNPPFAPPPLVSGRTLWYKAVTNNTYGHHGEMALPQMLTANFAPKNFKK